MAAQVSLHEQFEAVPDPRHASGRRHPLAAILTLTVVAMLGGARSLEAIVQFARDRGPRFTRLLGFTRKRPPCKATLSYLFRDLDHAVIESVITEWLHRCRGVDVEAIALDGKTARGSRDGELPGVHLLAAYAHDVHEVVAQMRVDAKTNEHKQALELLDLIPLEGKVVTGDAMFCERDLSEKVLKKGGTISGRSRTISHNSRRRSPRSLATTRRRTRRQRTSSGSTRPNARPPRPRKKATVASSSACSPAPPR